MDPDTEDLQLVYEITRGPQHGHVEHKLQPGRVAVTFTQGRDSETREMGGPYSTTTLPASPILHPLLASHPRVTYLQTSRSFSVKPSNFGILLLWYFSCNSELCPPPKTKSSLPCFLSSQIAVVWGHIFWKGSYDTASFPLKTATRIYERSVILCGLFFVLEGLWIFFKVHVQ